MFANILEFTVSLPYPIDEESSFGRANRLNKHHVARPLRKEIWQNMFLMHRIYEIVSNKNAFQLRRDASQI